MGGHRARWTLLPLRTGPVTGWVRAVRPSATVPVRPVHAWATGVDRPLARDESRSVSPSTERVVVALGWIAVVAWLASYSWLLGAVLPMQDVHVTTSPWLVAEVVAALVGAAAVVVAMAGSVEGAPVTRRARAGAVMGGAAAALALLSLAL